MEAKYAALDGPMFEQSEPGMRSLYSKGGAHYNIFDFSRAEDGMQVLRDYFPTGEADDLNFVLFSTSGVHGSYVQIEQIEEGLAKYGDAPSFGEELWPDDYYGNDLTVLIVHPRLVCLRFAQVRVTLADIPYLKKLRASSQKIASKIGGTEKRSRKPRAEGAAPQSATKGANP